MKVYHCMIELKEVHNFALKWLAKFQDKSVSYIDLVDHALADDCRALGFRMDCGQAFLAKYGNAVKDAEDLTEVLDDITDITLLGSAIYSRWRYFNHWAYNAVEILNPENRKWFVLALGRLEILSR